VYRVFESLDALVTVVEEARGLPMTANCVVPRGEMLDLLDDLREALPGELDDAQDVLDHRDELMSTAERAADEVTERAEREATELVERARAEADRLVGQARGQAEQLLGRARHEAERILADAHAEHHDLVERGRVAYERAVADGHAEQARLIAQTEVVRAAHLESGRIVDAGEEEAARRRAECDDYVESTLAEFEDTLLRTLQAVQRGRAQDRRRGLAGLLGGRERIGADLLD